MKNISIAIDKNKFRTRKSLITPKDEPSEKSKKDGLKIIGYKQEQDGHYFVPILEE